MKYLLILLFFFTSSHLYAQNSHQWRASIAFGVSESKDKSFGPDYNDARSLFFPSLGFSFYRPVEGIHGFSTGLHYFRVGDNYNYYTGINYETTDVKIYVNTVKVPVFYSAFFDGGEKLNFLIKGGPSLDFILGESVINSDKPLNNPEGFRNNVSQGKVGKRLSIPLNAAIGLSFKNKEGAMHGYVEVMYSGRLRNIYDDNSGSKSAFDNLSLRYVSFLSK